MSVWIALLRGINVGGRNVLPMKDLVKVMSRAGFDNVKTYIQSGNVVFRSNDSDAGKLADRIRDAIRDNHDFAPQVLVISAGTLHNSADDNPYSDAEVEPKSLHLFFLAARPGKANVAALESLRSRSESYALVDAILYLHAPDGIARSKLAKGAEKALGVAATARNWRTVTRLLEIAESME
jgi:uncharacterized protein (DUF1697 family)